MEHGHAVPAAADSMTTYTSSERELLLAVRDLVAADRMMREALAARMQMNVHDLQALRHVIKAHRAGGGATPRALSEELGISSASTTVLIDRLVAQGHLERAPHPTDGRSKTLVPTAAAHHEAREQLSPVHARMREVATAVPPDARPVVLDYLRSLSLVMLTEAGTPTEGAD